MNWYGQQVGRKYFLHCSLTCIISGMSQCWVYSINVFWINLSFLCSYWWVKSYFKFGFVIQCMFFFYHPILSLTAFLRLRMKTLWNPIITVHFIFYLIFSIIIPAIWEKFESIFKFYDLIISSYLFLAVINYLKEKSHLGRPWDVSWWLQLCANFLPHRSFFKSEVMLILSYLYILLS